jgi:NAD(P)-dependent dehydrogenase (short-subunit alcohol dehydrogenase family)
MDLASAKAVITGAASTHGLGFATAKKVIDAGGYAALLDVNDEEGEKSAAALGERAIYIHTDVSSESDVQAAIAKAGEFMDGITLAVSCAGIIGAARALGREAPMPGEFFLNTLKVNLLGSFLVAKEAANVMQHNAPNDDGERGLIVSTASIAAFEGQIGQVSYSASKGGVVGMTLPLAREFARIGIRVNVVAPGIFMTPMVAGMTPELQDSLGAQVPFPSRLGRPEEYADLVASIYGNAMINGETIRLDGAIRMQPK